MDTKHIAALNALYKLSNRECSKNPMLYCWR